MKTIKKIFWLIVLLFIIYVILIFVKPAFADQIADVLWIKSFNEKVRIIKKWLDVFSTKIPDKEELEETYSWAKEKIENLKENIDNIRKSAKDIEKKYEETKEFINETTEKIDKVKESLDDLQKVWNSISDIVNTWAIK